MPKRFAGVRWGMLFMTALCTCAADELEEPFKLTFWDKSVTLRGAIGYKDNVLLSKSAPQGSAFWLSGLDFTLIRASLEGGPKVTFFVSGEDRRYFSVPDVEKEQLLLAQAKISQTFFENWTVGLVGQYLYADQVFDATSAEQIPAILPVKSQNIQFAPSIARDLPWDTTLELNFTPERQIFQEPLDSYWEMGPQLLFTKKYGNRSEATLSYTYDDRQYDTRHPLTLQFSPLTNSVLRFQQHEFEASVNHSWDRARHWRTRTKMLFELSQDNGVGFYDFSRYRLTQRFGYYAKTWRATVEGKFLHYDYDVQPVPGTGQIRSLSEYVVTFHAEKTLWKKLSVFLESEYDKVESNYAIEQYDANTIMTGIDWEF